EMMNRHMKKIIQTISYLPHFLSWIIVAGIFYQMLSPGQTGIINGYLVKLFGIESIYFMAEQKYFVGITVFAEIWKSVGWSAILYFATLAGIDPTLYEVSYIDGASRSRQILHITLPSLMPVISLMLVLKISTIFTIGFERLFLLQNPLVLSVSEVISTYVYRVGLLKSQFSFTTAIGLTQSILGFLLLLGSNKLSKKLMGTGLY
ncbi:MAG: protein lplB, partial [Clostridiales bacterium GWC2_40_7]